MKYTYVCLQAKGRDISKGRDNSKGRDISKGRDVSLKCKHSSSRTQIYTLNVGFFPFFLSTYSILDSSESRESMNFPISTVHQLLARQKGDDYSFPYMSSSSRSLGFSAASIRAFTSLSSTRDLRHDGCINTCVFSGDGRVIVSGSDDRKLKLWNATSFQLLDEIQTRHRHNIFHVDFSHHAPDCLLSAAADGSLRITNILTKAETLLHSSENILHMFQIDVDNPFLVYTAEEEGHITRIDLRSRVTDMIFQNQISRQLRPVKALAQSSYSGGSQLLVGGYGLEVGVLDLRMTLPPSSTLSSADHNRFTQIFSPLESSTSTDPALGQAPGQFSSISVSGLDYNRNGRSFVVSYQSDQIYLFNTAITGTLKTGASAALGGHINHETFLKRVKFFGPRDEYVIAGSDHGYVWVWDANSGRLLPESSCYSQARYKYPVADREACRVVNVLKADKNACNGAIPHPFLPQFATYGIEDRLQVWGYRTPENAPPFKEGKNDTYVPYWRNYSSTSVMRGLPDYFEKRIAQVFRRVFLF